MVRKHSEVHKFGSGMFSTYLREMITTPWEWIPLGYAPNPLEKGDRYIPKTCEPHPDYRCFLQDFSPKCSADAPKLSLPGWTNESDFRKFFLNELKHLFDPYKVLAPFQILRKGNFWQVAQLWKRMYKFNEETRKSMDKLKNFAGVDKLLAKRIPYIGLHVRKQDACTTDAKHRKCLELETYYAELKKLKKLYNVSHVFVASDDNKVFNDSLAMFGHEFKIMRFPDSKLWDVKAAEKAWVEKQLAVSSAEIKVAAAIEAYATEETLAQSNFLVGQATSALFRVAMIHSYYIFNTINPYVSLDISWCFDGNAMTAGFARESTDPNYKPIWGC